MSPMLTVLLILIAGLLAVGGLTVMPPLLYVGIIIAIFTIVMTARPGKSQTGH